MQALTAIGEVGIEVEGRSYLLRPSLFSMTRIGTPAEIVEAVGLLMALEPKDPRHLKAFRRLRFETALTVVYACSGEQDTTELFGGAVPTGRGIGYSPGLVPMGDIVVLARSLLNHGVIGNVKPDPKRPAKKGDYLSEFKAAEYVACAMAHLGVAERDAWAMTMTSFSAAMRSKFPPPEETKPAPTAEVIDATMARLKRINELRAAKK